MRSGAAFASVALVSCAVAAYCGIFVEGIHARRLVVDPAVYAERLASSGEEPVNSALEPANGSASIGINYRFPSSVRWTLGPRQSRADDTRFLYVVGDDPQFFCATGFARIYVGSELVGALRAVRARNGTTFVASERQQPILLPPEKALGYRFAIRNALSCTAAACRVSVRGAWTFWHVYRLAIIDEKPRFDAATGL